MLKILAKWMGMKDLENRDDAEVRTVFLMLIMLVFLKMDFMLMVPSVPLIMGEFGKTEADVGLIGSMFIFTGAIIALIWGYLADSYERKYLVIFTIVIGEIPCLLTGYVRTYQELFIIRSLTGLGIGGIMPLIFSMIGDVVSERERTTAAAWVGLAEGLGQAGGMLLSGNLSESPITFLGASGWRLPFVIAAIPNFFIVPIFWLACREPVRGGGEIELKKYLEMGREYTRRIKLGDYISILKNRTNLYFFLQSIPGTVGWGVLPNWIIAYYVMEKKVPISLATNLMFILGLGMIMGGFFGGIIGNKLHAINKKYSPILCGVTTLLAVVFFFLVLHYPLPPIVVNVAQMTGPLLLGIVAGFLVTITSSNVRAMVLNVNPPENRGAIMSLFSLTDSVGIGLGPLLGGIMIVRMGYVSAMDFATLCWIPCGMIFLFLLTPQYPRDAARLDAVMKERAMEMEKKY